MANVDVRKGMPETKLDREEFGRRFRQLFYDPAFEPKQEQISELLNIAWEAYDDARKSPRNVAAGPGFADPDYELSVEWLAARDAIGKAKARHDDPRSPHRILLINGSMRSDQTCPGEISKSWRLTQIAAQRVKAESDFEIEVLDLSRLTSEYGRRIFPCKSCVSTAMPLCHWPCSCYPNHSLGQLSDWMNA